MDHVFVLLTSVAQPTSWIKPSLSSRYTYPSSAMASMRSLLKILIISMNLRMCFGQTVLVTGVDVIVTSTDVSGSMSSDSYHGLRQASSLL